MGGLFAHVDPSRLTEFRAQPALNASAAWVQSGEPCALWNPAARIPECFYFTELSSDFHRGDLVTSRLPLFTSAAGLGLLGKGYYRCLRLGQPHLHTL